MARRRFLARVWRRLKPPRRLRVTREGRYFLFVTVAIGLAAVNTGNNLLYLLLGWLFSMIVASGALSEASLRGLRVTRRPPPRVHANRPFLMEISVANLKHRLSSFSIEIEDLVDDKPLDKKCYFLKIPPGRTQSTSYRHTFSRRGRYEFDGFRVASKYPFALFRKSRDVDITGEILVYPAVYPVSRPPPSPRQIGDTTASRLDRRGEFFGLREFREGDDRRDIHWRSSARAGRLLVREYEQESQQRVTLLVDNALPPDAEPAAAEALEAAISLVASLAQSYLGAGYAVRLIARGSGVPLGNGPPQLVRILRTLALLPTVAPSAAFLGSVEPTIESVLVVPRGVPAAGRPGQVSHVLQP